MMMWWHGEDDGEENMKWDRMVQYQQVMRQQPRRIDSGGWEVQQQIQNLISESSGNMLEEGSLDDEFRGDLVF